MNKAPICIVAIALLFLVPQVVFGVLTEDFDGASLPAGWSFEDPLSAGASHGVSNSRVHVVVPSGTPIDSIFNAGSADNSVGVYHTIAGGGDIDIAAQIDTDVSQYDGLGINFVLEGDNPADAARFCAYQGSPSVYSFARSGGLSGFLDPAAISTWFYGLPAWFRVTYESATGIWTFYGSSDGANWIQIHQLTRSFTATQFKIGVTSTTAQPGGTVRINRVVDILATGSTDVREAIPEYLRTTVTAFEGSDGLLPADFFDDSANTGSISWTGTAMRMASDRDIDGSRARLGYTGATSTNSGVLARIQFPQATASSYAAVGIGRDVSGGIDQYSRGPAYAWELAGATYRRTIRVDEVGTTLVGGFEAQYTFLTNSTDYTLGGSPGPEFWVRVERVNNRIRSKIWLASTSEPAAFFFDGDDYVVEGPYGPALSWSHNDGITGAIEYMDVLHFEYYSISEIDTTNPEITFITPNDGAVVSGSSVALVATSTDDTAVGGVQFYYDTSNAIGSEITATSSPDTYTTTWDTTGLPDGDYTLIAVARDSADNYATSSTRTVTVDNSAPSRSGGAPAGVQSPGTTAVTLTLSTDEVATCKYDTNVDTSYASMSNTFATTSSTTHETSVVGLADDSSYTYYVRCSDPEGNANSTDFPISFSIGGSSGDNSGTTGGGALLNPGESRVGSSTKPNTEPPVAAPTVATSSPGFTSCSSPEQRATGEHSLVALVRALFTTGIIPPDKQIEACEVLQNLITNTDAQPPSREITPFSIPLMKGDQSEEVRRLQQFLNTRGFALTTEGPGSLGNETTFFGVRTIDAVKRFQNAYVTDILTPLGLTAPTGYWGQSSIKKANTLLFQ